MPCGPVSPVGPVLPIFPVGPTGPIGPVGPVAPVAPVGPVAPDRPVVPCGPVSPTEPTRPRGPAGPVAPLGPRGPRAPVGPWGPRGPRAPWTAPGVALRLHPLKPAVSRLAAASPMTICLRMGMCLRSAPCDPRRGGLRRGLDSCWAMLWRQANLRRELRDRPRDCGGDGSGCVMRAPRGAAQATGKPDRRCPDAGPGEGWKRRTRARVAGPLGSALASYTIPPEESAVRQHQEYIGARGA